MIKIQDIFIIIILVILGGFILFKGDSMGLPRETTNVVLGMFIVIVGGGYVLLKNI